MIKNDHVQIFFSWSELTGTRFPSSKVMTLHQGRSHWRGQGGHGPPIWISEQFQSQTIGIFAFYWYSEIIRTRNFAIFTVYATIFGQFTATFHFFKLHRRTRSLHIGPFEKVRYLTLDLLKSFIVDHPKEDHNELEFQH